MALAVLPLPSTWTDGVDFENVWCGSVEVLREAWRWRGSPLVAWLVRPSVLLFDETCGKLRWELTGYLVCCPLVCIFGVRIAALRRTSGPRGENLPRFGLPALVRDRGWKGGGREEK